MRRNERGRAFLVVGMLLASPSSAVASTDSQIPSTEDIGPSDASPDSVRPLAPFAADVGMDRASQAVRSTLATRDRALGLDQPAVGTVATTLEDSVRSSAAPGNASATFQVELSPGGFVVAVRVVDATAGDRPTWERVAQEAALALSQKSLSLRADAAHRGATVTVNVESRTIFPAGTTRKLEITPLCSAEIVIEASVARHGDPRPVAPISPTRQESCIPVGGAVVGDLSNIDSHRQRSVSSTLTVSVPGVLPMPERVRPVDTRVPWALPNPNLEPLPRR